MPKPLDAPKIDRLIAEVAARHGVLLKRDDAAFALVTLNQLVLEDEIKGLATEIRAATADFESAFERVQKRAGAALAQNLRQIVVERQHDLEEHLANLKGTPPARKPEWGGRLWLVPFVAGLAVGVLLRWVQ
jgi:hypothetical protein